MSTASPLALLGKGYRVNGGLNITRDIEDYLPAHENTQNIKDQQDNDSDDWKSCEENDDGTYDYDTWVKPEEKSDPKEKQSALKIIDQKVESGPEIKKKSRQVPAFLLRTEAQQKQMSEKQLMKQLIDETPKIIEVQKEKKLSDQRLTKLSEFNSNYNTKLIPKQKNKLRMRSNISTERMDDLSNQFSKLTLNSGIKRYAISPCQQVTKAKQFIAEEPFEKKQDLTQLFEELKLSPIEKHQEPVQLLKPIELVNDHHENLKVLPPKKRISNQATQIQHKKQTPIKSRPQVIDIPVILNYQTGLAQNKRVVHNFKFEYKAGSQNKQHLAQQGADKRFQYQLFFGDMILNKFFMHRYQYIATAIKNYFKTQSKEEQLQLPELPEEQQVDLSLSLESSFIEKLGFSTNSKFKVKKYLSYRNFQQRQDLAELFDLTDQKQVKFVKDILLRFQPNSKEDVPGWVYIYCREIDLIQMKNKKLSHMVLYKIGRTKNHPPRRVEQQQEKNQDGKYILQKTFATKYSILLEFLIHSYFDYARVVRTDKVVDGKTEWFLATFPEIEDIIIRIKQFMVRMFKDCGYEGIQLEDEKLNTKNEEHEDRQKTHDFSPIQTEEIESTVSNLTIASSQQQQLQEGLHSPQKTEVHHQYNTRFAKKIKQENSLPSFV